MLLEQTELTFFWLRCRLPIWNMLRVWFKSVLTRWKTFFTIVFPYPVSAAQFASICWKMFHFLHFQTTMSLISFRNNHKGLCKRKYSQYVRWLLSSNAPTKSTENAREWFKWKYCQKLPHYSLLFKWLFPWHTSNRYPSCYNSTYTYKEMASHLQHTKIANDIYSHIFLVCHMPPDS